MFKKTLIDWLKTNKYSMVEGAKRLGISYGSLYGYLYYGQKPSKKRNKNILFIIARYEESKNLIVESSSWGVSVSSEETFTISQIKEAMGKSFVTDSRICIVTENFMNSLGYKQDWVKK